MIRIYNTLNQEKEELLPLKPPHIGMYVCGPTTYNFIHLGNARPLVVFDTVRRYLKYRGYDVTYVQNFTDVDDKIINRAREAGEDPLKLSARYIDEYFLDADSLGVQRADVHPRVSQHIPDIIAAVEGLVKGGHAYPIDGDVYFRISSFPEYGKLSHRDQEEMLAGARVDIDDRKESPMDFALWKAAKPGEPAWDSPWGPGRPGWHIECSVMSTKYLGQTLDIHGGGFDLIFPHHENEVAQAEALSGQPFVNYWMHNGFITVNKEKMSKSLGNFFIVRDILTKYPPAVVRFFLLATHYRSPLDFDDSRLEEAGRALARLTTCRGLMKEYLSSAVVNHKTKIAETELLNEIANARLEFIEAMDDDFNTARALGHLFDICRLVNGYMAAHPNKKSEELTVVNQISETFEELYTLLGLDDCRQTAENSERVQLLLGVLINMRNRARTSKNYDLADRLRDQVVTWGIVLEDAAGTTRFKAEKFPADEAVAEYLVSLRTELKRGKQYKDADYLRELLQGAGVIVEDTREGARWRFEGIVSS
ncbi:MAG: cysteine--tRNA ligase [Methylocystaceae bacterium]